MTQKKFRAPTADGRLLYAIDPSDADALDGSSDFLGDTRGITFLTDGVEMVRRSGYGNQPRFLTAPANVAAVQYETSVGSRPVLGHRRTASIPALPEFVSPDEWVILRPSIGTDDDGDYLADAWYRAEYGEQPTEVRTLDLSGYSDFPVDLLDTESLTDPDPSFKWAVSAPYLVFGNEYEYALPGILSGYAERLAKAVDARTTAQIWTHKAREDSTVSGNITLTFEDKRTYPVKNTRGRTTHQASGTKSFSFDIPFPKTIAAKSKAQAIAKFDKLVDEIAEQIAGKNAVVCAHCSGDGVIVD
ncbi:hypothetical protein [Leifsonia sp. Leaf264]|uniref:hypothetical protein n=1 Tax=Leifsonia sp. Leaf264 TaxID=1736314 RepID=UPI0006F5FC57|nr:hypothetical protein [Leifsonia sp. Leaf264]KQO98195.1 hypothetical protein ASF30_09040 [Leifsonia sp. Leaf264]